MSLGSCRPASFCSATFGLVKMQYLVDLWSKNLLNALVEIQFARYVRWSRSKVPVSCENIENRAKKVDFEHQDTSELFPLVLEYCYQVFAHTDNNSSTT